MPQLEGKTALIAGAGRNNGKAIALAFAREGADLILVAREKSALTNTLNFVAKFDSFGNATQDTNIQHITGTQHLGFGLAPSPSTPLLFNGDINVVDQRNLQGH